MSKKKGTSSPQLKRELSLGAATAIVIGNMIGSGVFTSPQTLAEITNPYCNLLSWLITGMGSVLLALSFANLGTLYPETGGPIVYVGKAYGPFMAFLVSWTFWIGGWIGNGAIITTIIRYILFFLPQFKENQIFSFLISTLILWVFTGINLIGVKQAGYVGIISTLLKLSVIFIFIIIAGSGFNPAYLQTVSSPLVKGIKTLPNAVAISLWSFIGLESATVSAGEICKPEVNIRRSTFWGTLVTAGIYIVLAFLSMGALPQAQLAKTSAPLADIINAVTQAQWGGIFIALGIILSGLGAISGWVLTTARLSFAAGEEGLFPTFFTKISSVGTPWISLLITSGCTNVMLLLNYLMDLTTAFDFMVKLATLSFIPAYALTTGAELLLKYRNKRCHYRDTIRPFIAFIYSLYIIYGAGSDSAMWLLILMLAGIPFYVIQNIQLKDITK